MAKRIVTALVAIPIAIAMLMFYKTIVFNIAAATICTMIVFELLRATGCLENNWVSVSSLVFSAAFPIFMYKYLISALPFLFAIYYCGCLYC